MAAVDLGAQSGRVALGRFDGARLEVEEVHRFENVPVESGGALRWDFERLYAEALAGLRAAARDAAIDSVGVDSWAVDFGLVDDRDRLLEQPVHYRDAGRAAAVPKVLARVPARELYDRTGIQLLPINTLFQLATPATRELLPEAERLLLVPDLVNSRLCGSRTSELTNATTTQCFDPAAGDWAADLLVRLDLPHDLLPAVVAPGTPLGPVTPATADETGLGGAVAVAVATHDTGSAVAAVPLRGTGSVYLSVGTWSLVGVEVDAPVIDDRTFEANLTNEGGVAGTFRLLRNVTGLWLLHECRRVWAAEGEACSFDELVRLAETAPPLRSFVDPNAPLFAEPGDMPARIAAFCRETGQPEPDGIAATARCILESLALKHAETVDLLRDVTGVEAEELHVVGGGARNELLCAWTAQASGVPVSAGPEEATLVGNLLVQAMALGEVASLADAREVVRASFTPRRYEPAPSEEWAEARERFAQLTAVASRRLDGGDRRAEVPALPAPERVR
jgi:rhamnulokinase